MKKPILLMPIALAGCGEQPATISLYDADATGSVYNFSSPPLLSKVW